MLPRFLACVDLIDLGVINDSFVAQVVAKSLSAAKPAVLRGGTSTSLEAEGTRIDYRLLNGLDVLEEVPELDQLYRDALVPLASRLFGRDLIPSPEKVNGINVNILAAGGGRYEWHVDSNPITGLLVLSHCNPTQGGRLMFELDEEIRTSLSMRPGQFLVFDATRSPHAVEAVAGTKERLTAPMNFFLAGEEIVRPADLDSRLYGIDDGD